MFWPRWKKPSFLEKWCRCYWIRLPLLHPFYFFLVVAFYLYWFFFVLELSKILKYKPEQLYYRTVLQKLFRFSVFSIQIALNYSWWLFSFLGHCAWWIPQLWRRKSERVKHRLVHSFLSLRVSLTSGVTSVVTPIACNRGFSVIYIRDRSTELDQLFKSISTDGYSYD